ncbi:nicotinamide N-methyltransferase-like isoform X2 [Hyla sarda]|uniref:nicotinamide N-methyltransferase-like isoform X2 n=1 Tax=Hyla sarda TaxID=327740 RepID=UPI0024C3DFE3|nr:nicotinamide N-methyltransferase-like isoform X2 [Hyla sarda]
MDSPVRLTLPTERSLQHRWPGPAHPSFPPRGGHIKGNILADLSMGPVIHHLYSFCGLFNDIIVMRLTERCIMELNKWRHNRTGAYDWSHATNHITQLEGKCDEEKELTLKTTIKQVVRCNLEKENLIHPLDLPQADCLISAWLLECVSKDKEEYIKNLKKVVKFLKPGGHLILLGALNGTYYTVGEETFHLLTYDEIFAKETLTGEGFTIDDCEVLPRTAESDMTDYTSTMILIAHKD